VATDVILDDNDVRIEGWQLIVHGADLVIDAYNERRNGHLTGQRRAVVHGWNDTLMLNLAGDYTGGTVIQGDAVTAEGDVNCGANVSCKGTVTAGGVVCNGEAQCGVLNADDVVLWRTVTMPTMPGPGGTMVRGRTFTQKQSVNETITTLLERIDQLEAQVATLEGQHLDARVTALEQK
jgi:hypothetical protein